MQHSRNEDLDMYCRNHAEVGCITCMELNHRSCEDLKPIPDVIDVILKQSSDVEKTLLTLENKQACMIILKKNREINLQELIKSKEEEIITMRTFQQKLKQLPEYMKKKSVKEVENEFGKIESSLKHDIHAAEEEELALQKAKYALQNAKGNKGQELLCINIAKKNMEITESFIQSLQPPTDAKVLFPPNQEIVNFVQRMKSSRRVKICRLAASSSRKPLYAVKCAREVNIRTHDDTNTCCVLGSCFTQDGKLLLADYDNKQLKRVDLEKMVVIDQYKLDNKPYDVCCVTKQEAAVCLTNNTVQCVSLGNEMKLSRQIKVNHTCYGIAYHDDRLYITDGGKSLYIHDMTGNVLQTVTTDNSGNALFKWSTHIAFSDTGDKLFVTNGDDGVVALDADGTYLDTFRDRNLVSAFGVYADNCGNIFVSGYDSHNILQMSQDGKERFGEVVEESDGINFPYSVTVNPCGGTIVITQQENDTMKLFDFL